MIPFLVVSFAWFFQSVTGFGAGIIIIGVLSFLYDPKMVVVSSVIFNLFGTAGILYQNRKGRVDIPILLMLMLSSLPGIYLGAFLLEILDQKTLRMTIGTFILFIGLYDLMVGKGWLKFRLGKLMGMPAGFLGGFFAGLVGMGGPPPLVYLSHQLTDPNSIRLMLNLYFAFNLVFRLIFYSTLQVVNINIEFILLGLAGLVFGILVGGLIGQRMKPELFRAGVSYAVIILGVMLLVLSEIDV